MKTVANADQKAIMKPGSPFVSNAENLNRREAAGAIVSAAVLLPFAASPACAQARPEFSPEMFGARGDGRADDYEALVRLAAAVSQAGRGVVRFGYRKRYLIDRIRVSGGPQRNDLAHVVFQACNGLRVDLNQATIDVKGDFHRAGDERDGRRSFASAVIPLLFRNCTDLRVENGSINGNADRMTRDPRVAEADGHGLMLAGCDRVVLERLHIHHVSTDGVVIRPWSAERPSREIALREVRLTNNGRQGLTNAGGVAVTAVDSEFSETGLTGGSYRHAPSAGVDVEPHPGRATRSDFHAENCRFDNNRGSPVVAGSPDLARSVELVNCSGRCDSMRRMILSAEQTVIRGGNWHNVQIACAYAAHRPFEQGIAIEVSDGRWTGDDPAWAPLYDLNGKHPSVWLHDNRFEMRSTSPFASSSLFQCRNPNHRFESNEIFVSASGHDGEGLDLIGNFQGAALVARNRWSTDLRPPLRYFNNYVGTGRVEGESFSGSFIGRGP